MARPELSRGMKVRSSVKKLCDGCKVCTMVVIYALEGRRTYWRVVFEADDRFWGVEC